MSAPDFDRSSVAGLSQRLRGEEAPEYVGRLKKAGPLWTVQSFKERLLSDEAEAAADDAYVLEVKTARMMNRAPFFPMQAAIRAAIRAAEDGERK